MKRSFDFFVASLSLLILSPLILAIAVAIKAMSPGPIIYTQTRVGQGGRPFPMHKFRTMVPNADKLGSSVTTASDPRITSVGRFLRKTKLDELPQLWNVLKGDMSLVGPRPDVPGFADQLSGEDRVILTVRPGITGPATLNFRNEEEILAREPDPEHYNRTILYPAKVKLNREYVENYSFWMDLKYIFRTIFDR